MSHVFGKCGCNCGRCPAYHKNARTDEDRQRCSDGWNKYLGANLKPERCYCLGCQAADPWKTGNVLPDRSCNIRPCVIKNSVRGCAYCSAFPCESLKARIPDEHFRQGMEQRLGRPIPEEDYLAFIQPYEGLKHSADLRASIPHEEIIDPVKPVPLRAKIVDFPVDLPLAPDERAGLEALHGLLTRILTAQTETYALQEARKRKRHNILSLLWIFGHLGEPADSGTQLVIDAKAHGARKELGNIVRKRDNNLHVPARQALSLLATYGVHGEHVATSRKDWKLKLRFEEGAGGAAALKALKHYVNALVGTHGEPAYAGSSRFKGKAFQLFSRADMRDLK